MRIKGIKETCIYSADLDGIKAFYHTILGLEVISHVADKHIFFRVGYSVLLVFNPEDAKTKKSPPPHYANGPQHFAFEVAPEEYDDWKKKIVDLNIPIIDEVIWASGQESFYFNDPDGHVLEIIPEGIWDPGDPTSV
jgi:catechol 2,3-dioxygenase-like lactoylglutathione lyase family enzyme